MSQKNETTTDAIKAEEPSSTFHLQKIYVKDVSFETPHSPQIFQEQWKPKVNMDISNTARSLSTGQYEVVLAVTVKVTFEERNVYLIEIHQAGIFRMSGFTDEILDRMLATACPNILFPFAREMVSDIVIRGGFPQLLLAPINFEALYLQQMKTEAEQSGDNKTRH
jgi:preprotein translocase subunit SecB